MDGEKSLILGCDNTEDLSAVLKSLRSSVHLSCNVITAGRVSDVININRSLSCDLIILFFQNNQEALQECFAHHIQHIPILCITSQTARPLVWPHSSIVFTYAAKDIFITDYLASAIQSILLLTKNAGGNFQKEKPVEKKGISASGYADDLSRYVMELDHKSEVLSTIKEKISDLYPRVDDSTRSALNSIVNSIKMSANDEKLWEDFRIFYEMNDPGFLIQLVRKHPDLTTRDLKYCCYLKMNMSNDDIKTLLGINQESVRTHKYRLKKKMSLPQEQDLRAYLLNVCAQ